MAKDKKEKETVLTIHDFKVMIEGMDMVLGDNWYPTETQWKRIRQKLDSIIDNVDRPQPNPRSNVALPGTPVDNLINNFPLTPVAADVPIGEAPPSFVQPPSALTPAPTVGPEGEPVHTSNEFI